MIIHLNFKDKVVLILFLKIHLFSLHHKNGTRGTCTRDVTFLHIYIYIQTVWMNRAGLFCLWRTNLINFSHEFYVHN